MRRRARKQKDAKREEKAIKAGFGAVCGDSEQMHCNQRATCDVRGCYGGARTTGGRVVVEQTMGLMMMRMMLTVMMVGDVQRASE